MLETAKKAALLAGDILDRYFDNLVSIETKDAAGKDIVTVADKEAEHIIKQTLLGTYPEHGFFGEETGKQNEASAYVWVVDPLDGTTNFSRNIPTHAVSIALLHDREVILGVVYIPKTKELFWAEKGSGAYCNGKKISVSETAELRDAMCSIAYYSKKDGYADRGLADYCLFARQTRKIRSLSSTVFELCRVAKGNLDFCILDTYFLDLSAAKLILEEAGGVCRTYNDAVIEPSFESIVTRIIASSRTIEPVVRQALEKK